MNGLPDYCKSCGHAIYESNDGKWKHANQDGEKAAEKDGHEAEGPPPTPQVVLREEEGEC